MTIRSGIPRLARTGLVAYLTGWFAIAPVLVVCLCSHSHAKVAPAMHAGPASVHTHHGPDGHHPDHHDESHRDTPEMDDYPAPTKPTTLSPMVAVAAVVCDDHTSLTSGRAAGPHLAQQPHGPPESLRCAIACAVLLV